MNSPKKRKTVLDKLYPGGQKPIHCAEKDYICKMFDDNSGSVKIQSEQGKKK